MADTPNCPGLFSALSVDSVEVGLYSFIFGVLKKSECAFLKLESEKYKNDAVENKIVRKLASYFCASLKSNNSTDTLLLSAKKPIDKNRFF